MDAASLLKRIARPLPAALAATIVCLLGVPAVSSGDLQTSLSGRTAAADRLRAGIAAETRRIAITSGGVRQAELRLSALQAKAAAREGQLAAVQGLLIAARNRLTKLENRLHRASTALSANLVATYEGGTPDVITVVLESHGFADLLDRIDFLRRAGLHDAEIVSHARTARVAVLAQALALEGLQSRDQALANQVVAARDAAAAVQGALLERQAAQLRGRAGDQAALARVRGQISALTSRIARAQAPAAAPTGGGSGGGGTVGPLPIDPGGMAQAPAGAPAAVRQVIAAGNAIAGLPYLYGGGHASFHAQAYDCSGSVSYALAAAGLLSSPLDSTGFESWGQPGPGQWITVYANAGHAFMVVAGWRFDTVALSSGGTRWTRTMADTSAFVARHPAGL
ncbi:MAG: coiled-coil domain-containing protein [Solirubrobacteraceae bacterium]